MSLGLQRLRDLTGVKLLPPRDTRLASELARFRRAVVGTPGRPELTQVLLALARDPHHMLRAREVWVQERRARCSHPARLSLAMISGPYGAQAQDRRLILDTQVNHTPDVYENRLIKTYVYQVQLRLRRLGRAIEGGKQEALLADAQGLLIAHLPDDIANPCPIHQNSTLLLSCARRLGTVPVRVWQASSPKETSRR